MKKVLLSLGIIIFVGAVGFFLFKNRPTELGVYKIMNPTYFDSKSKIGRVIARRFYAQFKKAKLIILGSSALVPGHHEIWHELIKASLVDGVEFDDFITLKGLRPLTNKDRIVSDLPKIELGPGRTVLHVPSNEYWREKVQKAYPHADYIFFQAPYSLLKEGRKKLGLECKNEQDESFACLAYEAGTRYYRKKLKENRLTAMMEQSQENFYLLFIGEKY